MDDVPNQRDAVVDQHSNNRSTSTQHYHQKVLIPSYLAYAAFLSLAHPSTSLSTALFHRIISPSMHIAAKSVTQTSYLA
jgi:hypothetical protein